MHEILNRAREISCKLIHHYERSTYCCPTWITRVVIDDVKMSFETGPDPDYIHGRPEAKMPSDWEECREKWNVKELAAADLRDVFQHLVIFGTQDYYTRTNSNYPWGEQGLTFPSPPPQNLTF